MYFTSYVQKFLVNFCVLLHVFQGAVGLFINYNFFFSKYGIVK